MPIVGMCFASSDNCASNLTQNLKPRYTKKCVTARFLCLGVTNAKYALNASTRVRKRVFCNKTVITGHGDAICTIPDRFLLQKLKLFPRQALCDCRLADVFDTVGPMATD